MAIIIKDYEPSGDKTSLKFPSGKEYVIPTSAVLTGGELVEITHGNIDILLDKLPADARTELLSLPKAALQQFAEDWASDPKD